jgi:hypothetical protein
MLSHTLSPLEVREHIKANPVFRQPFMLDNGKRLDIVTTFVLSGWMAHPVTFLEVNVKDEPIYTGTDILEAVNAFNGASV